MDISIWGKCSRPYSWNNREKEKSKESLNRNNWSFLVVGAFSYHSNQCIGHELTFPWRRFTLPDTTPQIDFMHPQWTSSLTP